MSAEYDRKREKTAERQREVAQKGRDIGSIPPVSDPERRKRASESFETFCREYHGEKFTLAWSADQRKVIDYIQRCVTGGGQFGFGMPRGSGKTTFCEIATEWAVLTGKRQFVVFIGADKPSALERLETIRVDLETNEALLADFPEVCYPIRMLEGITHRCAGQLCEGERTQIEWTSEQLVLPKIPGSVASGAVIRVAGITGTIRGMKVMRSDGKSVRPDLVIIDDPQTDESAKSPSQSASREKVIDGAVLGLAGPGKKIAALMPCTVIAKGDLADRLLDRKLHPAWQGERMKALYSLPKNLGLWELYKQKLDDSLRNGTEGRDATEFYRVNREKMDEGAVVAWPDRHEPNQLSGIEYCMSLYLARPLTFAAEYQNEPMVGSEQFELLTAQQIADRFTRLDRGLVPAGADTLVAMVDVQEHALYWMVAAFGSDAQAQVVDYGIYPEQSIPGYFTYREIKTKLSDVHKGAGLQGAIIAGLKALEAKLVARKFVRDADGVQLGVLQQLIDFGWNQSEQAILTYARQSAHSAIILPSKGHGIGAAFAPLADWGKRPGDRPGDHWRIRVANGRRSVAFDTNFWKTTVHKSLGTPIGDPGALTLFGDSSATHRMLSDHLTSEYPVAVTARGRTVDEWKNKPAKPDNHWFDCIVGCYVAASIAGVKRAGTVVEPPKERKVVSFAEAKAHRTVHKARRSA